MLLGIFCLHYFCSTPGHLPLCLLHTLVSKSYVLPLLINSHIFRRIDLQNRKNYFVFSCGTRIAARKLGSKLCTQPYLDT